MKNVAAGLNSWRKRRNFASRILSNDRSLRCGKPSRPSL